MELDICFHKPGYIIIHQTTNEITENTLHIELPVSQSPRLIDMSSTVTLQVLLSSLYGEMLKAYVLYSVNNNVTYT